MGVRSSCYCNYLLRVVMIASQDKIFVNFNSKGCMKAYMWGFVVVIVVIVYYV